MKTRQTELEELPSMGLKFNKTDGDKLADKQNNHKSRLRKLYFFHMEYASKEIITKDFTK